MKTFLLTTYPIVAGIPVEDRIDLRVKSEKEAIKRASSKHLHFTLQEMFFDIDGNRAYGEPVKYVNYNGILEVNDSQSTFKI